MKPWSNHELEELRRLYPAHSAKQIARILRRSRSSVRSKAKVLKIKRIRKYKWWTPEELQRLGRLYPTWNTGDLARMFNTTVASVYAARSSNLPSMHKSKERIREDARQNMMRPDHPAHASQFKAGHVPANKGLRRPGWVRGRMAETQFKKGVRAGAAQAKWKPVGTIMLRDGYLIMKVKDEPQDIAGIGAQSTNWMYVHKMVWEQAHGPIPAGHRIWWKDRDHLNCDLENLELLSGKEHMARTTIQNLPQPLKSAIVALGALNRKIRRMYAAKQAGGSSQSPVRNDRTAQGS
jgi:hypothetical protein